MLTAPDKGESGLWLTISAIAARKSVTKQTISERVARLEREGKLKTRPGRGNAKLVDLAEYDRAVGETTDLIRGQAAETVRSRARESEPSSRSNGELRTSVSSPPASEPTFSDAQKQKAFYEAGIRALDYAERTGEVLPVNGPNGIAAAMAVAGTKILTAITRLQTRAAELATAVVKEGETGARRVLKEMERDLRQEIGRVLRLLEEDGRRQEVGGGCEIEIALPGDVATPNSFDPTSKDS